MKKAAEFLALNFFLDKAIEAHTGLYQKQQQQIYNRK